jgi:hypothetical protein
MKYLYVQTTGPVMAFQLAATATAFSDLGWEYVDGLYYALAAPQQSIVTQQKVAPIPCFILLFRKQYDEKSGPPPVPPESVQIPGMQEGGKGRSLPFGKDRK